MSKPKPEHDADNTAIFISFMALGQALTDVLMVTTDTDNHTEFLLCLHIVTNHALCTPPHI